MRWLLFALGLLLAVLALYALVAGGGLLEEPEIDEESRARLREVLEQGGEP